jgi:hypothetical protein
VTSFPESNSRKGRFLGFIDYSKHICKRISKKNKFIMNGSYTTTKNNPNDIDFLIVFNVSRMNKDECEFVEREWEMQSELNDQRHMMIELSKKGLVDINDVYCCDWYPLYQRDPDDKKYDDYLKDKKYWLDFWSKSRKDKNGIQNPKGLIVFELELDLLEELYE